MIYLFASGHKAKMRVRMILDDPDDNLPDDLVLADLPGAIASEQTRRVE